MRGIGICSQVKWSKPKPYVSNFIGRRYFSTILFCCRSFDASRLSRGFKGAALFVASFLNLYTFYRNLFVYPTQFAPGHGPWLNTVTVCLANECFSTQTIRLQVFLFDYIPVMNIIFRRSWILIENWTKQIHIVHRYFIYLKMFSSVILLNIWITKLADFCKYIF